MLVHQRVKSMKTGGKTSFIYEKDDEEW